MFLPNKYAKAYHKLCNRAKGRVRVGYMESHHIIPESLGGPNTKENRVWLTAREHFIAHLLLVKAVQGRNSKYKMAHALWFFQSNKKHNGLTYTSKTYEFMRKQKSVAMSQPHSPETIAKRAASNTGKKRTEEQLKNLQAGQQNYYANVDRTILLERGKKAGEARAKTWKVEREDGYIFEVKNLKSFSIEHGIRGTMLYKTVHNRKFVNGFRIGK